MQNRCFFAAILFFSTGAFAQTTADRQKAETLLRQMTLEEKIGQMTQVTLGVISTAEDGVLDPAALRKAVQDYKVGSILNVSNHALTAEQWRRVHNANTG